MRILICGDVVGRAGRRAVCDALPRLRHELDLDFVVVNGENAAGGFGITPKICDQFLAAGADAITTGNHAWDQKEIVPHFEREKRLLRPHNYPEGTPGSGVVTLPDRQGRPVLVLHFMALLFMPPLDDPFAGIQTALLNRHLGSGLAAIILDFHGEATSEKMAMGHHCDGRVSMVVGTHTHVPTADHQVLPGGTAYMSDAGMCGDYDSVIGMKKGPATLRFVNKMPGERLSPALGEATACGVMVETDDATGLALDVAPVRIGGRLAPALPAWGARQGRSAAAE